MITKRHSHWAFVQLACIGDAGRLAIGAISDRLKGARIMVGFGPGGALDVVARLLTTAMKDYARHSLSKIDPAQASASRSKLSNPAPPTARACLTGSSSMASFRMSTRSSIRSIAGFTPVTTVAISVPAHGWSMVPGQVKTLADFILWCRANPRQATYGTIGAGSLLHFIGVTLARAAGFEFVHVPYQGLAAVQDLLAGRIAATIFPPTVSLPYIQSGELRALMTTGTRRSASFPTCRRQRTRYPAIEEDDWFGIFVPARTPAKRSKPLTPQSAQRSSPTMSKLAWRSCLSSRPEIRWKNSRGLVRSEFRPVGSDRGGIRVPGRELRCERLTDSRTLFPLG